MSSGIGKLVPIVLLLFFFMIGTVYVSGIMSSADEDMNISEEYQDQHNRSVEIQTGTFSIINIIPILLGVFGLVSVLVLFKKKYS